MSPCGPSNEEGCQSTGPPPACGPSPHDREPSSTGWLAVEWRLQAAKSTPLCKLWMQKPILHAAAPTARRARCEPRGGRGQQGRLLPAAAVQGRAWWRWYTHALQPHYYACGASRKLLRDADHTRGLHSRRQWRKVGGAPLGNLNGRGSSAAAWCRVLAGVGGSWPRAPAAAAAAPGGAAHGSYSSASDSTCAGITGGRPPGRQHLRASWQRRGIRGAADCG